MAKKRETEGEKEEKRRSERRNERRKKRRKEIRLSSVSSGLHTQLCSEAEGSDRRLKGSKIEVHHPPRSQIGRIRIQSDV